MLVKHPNPLILLVEASLLESAYPWRTPYGVPSNLLAGAVVPEDWRRQEYLLSAAVVVLQSPVSGSDKGNSDVDRKHSRASALKERDNALDVALI